MKEFTLFDLYFELQLNRSTPAYHNSFGFMIRGVVHNEKYIEFCNYKSSEAVILIKYDWQGTELEEDSLDVLKDTRILEYIFKFSNTIKNRIVAHEQFIIENKAFVKEIDRLDKYKILL